MALRSSRAELRTSARLLISARHSEASRLMARWESAAPLHSGLPLLAASSRCVSELRARSSEAHRGALSFFPHSSNASFSDAPARSTPSPAAPSSAGCRPSAAHANSAPTPESGPSNLFGKQINGDSHSTCFHLPIESKTKDMTKSERKKSEE